MVHPKRLPCLYDCRLMNLWSLGHYSDNLGVSNFGCHARTVLGGAVGMRFMLV